MKKQLFLLFLAPFSIFSQALFSLEYNNTKGMVTNQGYLFNSASTSQASYIVPKSLSGINPVHSVYITSFLAMGKVNDILMGVGSTYNNFEFGSGPIADNYTASGYFSKYERLWSVYRTEILQHIQSWDQPGYTMPLSILNWPGNGDVSNGEAQLLAPFVDLNSNNIYEPILGDYPDIRGDHAVYGILNDENCSHTASGLSSLKQEIHFMVYQYATDDYINETTFIHVQIFNRSEDIYEEYKFGLFNDYDLGNPTDDFTGSDSDLSLSYVYNADGSDEQNGSTNGYGANPPAFGFMEMNHNLSSNVKYNATNSNVSLYNNLNGLQGNGSAILDYAGDPTGFDYDNSTNQQWNEVAEGNMKGDRTMVLGTTTCSINPNESICRDFAMIYARSDQYVTSFESVDLLKSNAVLVQQFYDSLNFACDQSAGINEMDMAGNMVVVYPNPAENLIHVGVSDVPMDFIITTIDGKRVSEGETESNVIDVSFLDSGIYHLMIIKNEGSTIQQFIKK